MIAPKRLKLRLSGSARKSQKRFRETPRFKFRAAWARTQPCLSHSVEKRGDQSRFKCRKKVNYYAIRSTLSHVTCHSFRYQSCVVTTPLGWSGCSTGRVVSGCRPELARHCLQSSPCRPCARRTKRSCMHNDIDMWQRKTTQQSGQVRSCQVRTWSGQVRWQDSPALSADAIAKWNVTRGMTIRYRWWDDAAVRLTAQHNVRVRSCIIW
eukprot:COSAG06_NODE_2631_length_6549_cov_4.290078_3_plen_209_part_00